MFKCDTVVIFALEDESSCLENRLGNRRKIQAYDFHVIIGRLGTQAVGVIRSGAGVENAYRVTQAVIRAHKPESVISAGFAGALNPVFKKYDIFLPSEYCDEKFQITPAHPLEEKVLLHHGTCAVIRDGGRLLTTQKIVDSCEEKLALGKKYTASGVDMETQGVLRACEETGTIMHSVRIISDVCGENIPSDIGKLLKQKTFMSRLGAAFSVALKRPSSVKDMYHLRETALTASVELANFLEHLWKGMK